MPRPAIACGGLDVLPLACRGRNGDEPPAAHSPPWSPMVEHVRELRRNTHPVLDSVLYWRISAWVLAAVAVVGFILEAGGLAAILGRDLLVFDMTHNMLHMVLAAAAFVFGYTDMEKGVVKTFAVIFGIIYLGLGLVGFFVAQILTVGLELGENLLHLLLGAWGLSAGLAGRK